MCLAIVMYLVTGALSVVWQLFMAVGIFLMTLLGRLILFVCASVYTVARPAGPAIEIGPPEPFVTMYPELHGFEEDYETMARVSLETVTSAEEIACRPRSEQTLARARPPTRRNSK